MTRPIILEFTFGLFLAELLRQCPQKMERWGFLLLSLGTISFLGPATFGFGYGIRVLGWGIPAMLFVGAFVLLEQKLPKTGYLSMAACKIGDASYSIYLTQVFTLPVLAVVLGKLLPANLVSHLFAMVVAIPIAVGVGILVWLLVEKPLVMVLKLRFWRG